MNVMADLHDAVFMNAGSYVMSPKSSSPVLIFLRSSARIVPFSIGSSYVFPVRLSVIVIVFFSAIRSFRSPPGGPSGILCPSRAGLPRRSACIECLP